MSKYDVLKALRNCDSVKGDIYDRAADEIEALRAENEALRAKHEAAANGLLSIYENACHRYGRPAMQPSGKISASNGFMAEVLDLLPVMGALDCLPEPWKLEGNNDEPAL